MIKIIRVRKVENLNIFKCKVTMIQIYVFYLGPHYLIWNLLNYLNSYLVFTFLFFNSIFESGPLAKWVACSQMVRVQYQVESYQSLKKWYLILPCLTLSTIRKGSRVKWSNPGNGVALSSYTSNIEKRDFGSPSTKVTNNLYYNALHPEHCPVG